MLHCSLESGIFWEDGNDITPLVPEVIQQLNSPTITAKTPKRKVSTTLPHWLDILLFNSFNALYAPEYKKFEYNLELDGDSIRVYLGTYFPRSYAEMFCIMSNLFQNHIISDICSAKDKISILDFGCGTGGEIIGALTAIERYYQSIKTVEILAIDGNLLALESLRKIVEELKNHVGFSVDLKTEHVQVVSTESVYQIVSQTGLFDFVLCGKMGCELKSHKIISDAYLIISRALSPHLSDNGFFILLDVTTKNETSGRFYPQEMNSEINCFMTEQDEYRTVLPIACSMELGCNVLCFIQQAFKVQHSRKRADESRICYRVMCKTPLMRELASNGYPCGRHIISPIRHAKNEIDGLCPKTSGDHDVDSYDINIL